MQSRQKGRYKILLNKKWRFEEFSELPHLFNQVYAFNYAFYDDGTVSAILAHAFRAFPWIGGYSAVNFYRTLSYQIPRSLEPTVESIVFRSPGFIDLTLYVEAARQLGEIIGYLSGAGLGVHTLYNKIRTEASKRELLSIEVQKQRQALKQSDIRFAISASQELAKALKFQGLNELEALTENHLITLKILLSYCRRLEPLADFQLNGKAYFPSHSDEVE